MINQPYKDIPQDIKDVLEGLIAPEYMYHRTHKRRMARTLDVLMKEKPKGKLLELGTSSIIPLALQQLVPNLEVHVTDFNLKEEQQGEVFLQMKEHSGTFPVYRVDLETQSLPAEDNTYDYVLCCEVIEHLELDPMFMMAEINRVLKQEGTLILTTPNVVSSRGISKMLKGYEPYFYMQYRTSPKLYRHNYEYSLPSLKQVLKAGGFNGSIWTEDSFEEPIMVDVENLRKLGYPIVDVGDNIFAVMKRTRDVVARYPNIIYSD